MKVSDFGWERNLSRLRAARRLSRAQTADKRRVVIRGIARHMADARQRTQIPGLAVHDNR